MRNPIETYVSYDEDGSMKLSIPTTLFGGYVEHLIKFFEEHYNSLFLVLHIHNLDGQFYDIDCGE